MQNYVATYTYFTCIPKTAFQSGLRLMKHHLLPSLFSGRDFTSMLHRFFLSLLSNQESTLSSSSTSSYTKHGVGNTWLL